MKATDDSKSDVGPSVVAQAKVRLKLGLPVILIMMLSVWYWGSPHGERGYAVAAFVAVLHISYIYAAYYLSIRMRPFTPEQLVVATAVLDPLLLSGWVGVMNESGGLFVCFYLFTILGFGFRIGIRPMWICQVVAVIGYCTVLAISPTWRELPVVGFSYLMLLVVVPIYATILIKKLRDARAYAESESQAKSQLLANVSHELRTPLSGIVASAQLIADSTNDVSIVNRTGIITRLSKDLLVEINDLLDSAKYQANSLVLEKELFDLHDIVEQVDATLSTAAASKGIGFIITTDPAIQDPVFGDAHYLSRVLINIAGNAVKFTEKGRVELQLRLLENETDHYRIRFSVRDTGIGIPQEFHQKIFDPFFQASGGTTRKYGGTGLGMSIAKEVVNLMGGELLLESDPGKGSLFYFEIKLSKGTAIPKAAIALPEPIIFSKRILVADDNATNLVLIKELLQRDRHAVVTAASGQEAVELLASMQFDLIFLDFNMGDMDGATVLQIYRFGKINPAPAFFLTADTTARTGKLLEESGAAGVLHKPITGDGLRAAVAQIFKPEVTDVADVSIKPAPAKIKPVPNQYIDHVAIEDLKEVCSRSGFIIEVLSTAIEDIEKNCDYIIEGLKTDDIDAVRDKAHALKGLSASVGAVRLASLAHKLMNITWAELKPIQNRYKADIDEACTKSVSALREILAEQSTTRLRK